MPRYMSISFPYLLTDYLVRKQPELQGVPFVLASRQRGRMVIDAVRLQFMTKKPGLSLSLKPAEMVFDYFSCSTETPEAYETLILDALLGDATLFMRSDQVEEAWDVVTTVQQAWENNSTQELHNYEAGSWGPAAADELLARQGHTWISNTYNNIKEKVTDGNDF